MMSISPTEEKPNTTKIPILNDRGPTGNVQPEFLIWLRSSIPMGVVMGSAFATVLIGVLSTRRKKR